jgi:hypothetical protein
MKAWVQLAAAASLAAMTGNAFALCKDGPPFACTTTNGKPGERQCVGGHITQCIPNDTGPGSQTGTLAPRYFILTVVYAPPGTQGGKSTSSVTYGSGSTTGTTTSATKTFKQSYSITATAGVGILGNGGSVGVSFGYGRNSTDTQALNITKATTSTIQDVGPSTDGIDHDHDLIYLWLNPTVNVTLTGKQAAWSISGAGTAEIQYVYVGWLKHPDQLPPGVAQIFQKHGLTAQDYANILKQDPFANGPGTVGARFKPLNTTFPYEPPFSASDPVPTYSFSVTDSSVTTNTSSVENDYKVELDIKTGANFIASASLENKDSWEWDNTSSKSDSATATQSAAVTVGGPSFGYTGPTDIEVYYDAIYKTFMFRALDPSQPLAFKGTWKSRAGQPVGFKEVIVNTKGGTYRTFTNAKGEYRVYGKIIGPATIRAGSITQNLTAIEPNKGVELRQP